MNTIATWRQRLAEGHTETWLKIAIIVVALTIILLALFINNKWVLAALLLYEVLP